MTGESETSECRRWRSLADLMGTHAGARAAFVGAPLGEKSLTPGRCDLAPKVLRETLKRFSVYDLESGADLAALRIDDRGDVNLKARTPEESFEPLRNAVAAAAKDRALVIIAGGNNAVTRPGVHGLAHGLGRDLSRIGLLTLDAHFDLRDTDCGLTNGNPVQALLDDGFDGGNLVQIGLAPFANTKRMHDKAKAAGALTRTIAECVEHGTLRLVEEGLDRLAARCDAIYVDFDIDVIDRSECPGAPGARPAPPARTRKSAPSTSPSSTPPSMSAT